MEEGHGLVMGEYIFKRKEGDGEWKDNSNCVRDAKEATLEIVSEIQSEMKLGHAVFIIIFAAPNTEVSNLKESLEGWVKESKNSKRIELIFEGKTMECYYSVILEAIVQAGVIPWVKPYIEENKLESMRNHFKGILKEDLKENFIFILPHNFPKETGDDQAFIENLILLCADILGKHPIMYQCINKKQVIRLYEDLINQIQGLHLQDLLNECDNLLEAIPNNATIIDEIIEIHDIQVTEEHGIKDKVSGIDDAIGKENIEYAER